MSDNKFIERLKGKDTSKSILEINNEAAKTSFANMPSGTSNAIDVYSDHRADATAVLNGTINWKISNNNLILANGVAGDGTDFSSTYSVSGAGLWIDSVYTFPSTGDPAHPVAMVFNPSTKWVLKVCGDNLIVDGGYIADFTLLVKIGTSNVFTKTFSVAEQAGPFCKEFVLDFNETNAGIIKASGLTTLTVQLLCGTANASARIYNGMTVLTCLQRKVDASAVSTSFANVEEALQDGMLPSDYFNNAAFIDQVEDGEQAYAIFERDGDTIDLAGWTPKDAVAYKDEVIIKAEVMPTPNADLVGAIYQYTGVTSAPYEHGYIYECKETSPGVYGWERIDVQPGGSRGRFLALWNCATGLSESNPPYSPYEYKTGDYFIVSVISSATPAVNYKPDGSSYTTGVASTTVETNEVSVNDTYFYDGTTWKLQSNAQKEVSFSALAGSPYDNTALSNALNSKVDETSSANQVYGTDQNGDPTTYNTTDFGAVDDVQVNNVSVVTSKIANIDLTNYVTLSTTQAITGTKTFKSEILSWNNITFESAQANPIIRGMSGASHRNMITRTNSASAIDVGNTSDTINFKGSGTRPTYNNNDLALYSDVPSLTGYIQNTATGTDSLTVLGTAASSTNSVNIGTGAGASGNKAVSVGDYASAEGEGSIAIGGDSSTTYRARATHKGNVAIGHDAYAINATGIISIGESAHAQSTNAIQLGTGNNNTANTFQVRSYTLLDTSTGLIPDARISTNITRTADLATVATTGDYDDLINKPTIPAAQVNSDWNANSGVAQILNKPTLAAVATSGNYSDLVGKPTIPTVNNSTITITQGGVTKGSFTLNQASGDTIALDAGGGGVGNIDNITITTNADSEIQAVAVIDQNTGIAKTWTGTMAEYDAIVTKDPETEYIITDDIGGSATEIGQITEALNDKVDKGHQVIDFQEPTAANNYTWYRKYADGWVEQGGQGQVTTNGTGNTFSLPVAMVDTNYTIVVAKWAGDTGNVGFNAEPATTTTFKAGVAYTSALTRSFTWQVSGMAA